jgi:hypothetical protein
MMSTRVQLSFDRPDENFTLGFDLKEESLGEIFDKLEIMLVALGFVLEGKMLSLVDMDDVSVDNSSGPGFLAEDSMTTTFTIHPGGKV